ncbi:MAG: hypothetical protein AAF206_21615 [Bacteroidota bacterium]
MFSKRTIVPWIMVLALSGFVYGLTWRAENRTPPEPAYDFYDTAVVHVHILGSVERHDVYGRFNNVLEGERKLIKASEQAEGIYRLVFQVNSPRPATLFVNDEVTEVFLQPGDTSLQVNMFVAPISYSIDSLSFSGKMAPICDYLAEKQTRFGQVEMHRVRNIMDSEDFAGYAAKLDSTAAQELAFLAEREIQPDFPDWFADYERNDILYQKAYLKLSRSYNRDVPQELLDDLPLNNQAAVFSYYYFLYVKSFLSNLAHQSVQEAEYPKALIRQIQLADSLLDREAHDIYLTRLLFDNLERGAVNPTRQLLNKYEDSFFSKKYERFLRMQIKLKREVNQADA